MNTIETFEIVDKHLGKTHSILVCIHIAQTLNDYYNKLKKLDEYCPEIVAETIIHDYKGLRSGDEFFLPRLA